MGALLGLEFEEGGGLPAVKTSNPSMSLFSTGGGDELNELPAHEMYHSIFCSPEASDPSSLALFHPSLTPTARRRREIL